ncbi:GIY-YIG nuclease family protein [Halorubellus litoreus]|uniref:GIY-YIG nuclease family protein n=1 Tax=Halorubellus litoreus TaxID=755308 RepID=A0ABD5VDQ1_9EURY
MSDHYVYVLECADGTYYTGYTTDVERRVDEHDAGDGAKYTRGRTPVSLVHVETYDSRSAAMSREHEVKTFSRARKERLVASDRGDAPSDATADAE